MYIYNYCDFNFRKYQYGLWLRTNKNKYSVYPDILYYILEIYKEHISLLDKKYLYGEVLQYGRTMVLAKINLLNNKF